MGGERTDSEFLNLLQEKMDERLERRVPVGGLFCSHCYGRLRETDTNCPFCGRDIRTVGTADEIPQEVLRAYRAKSRTEATWVYGFGFLGLIIACILFVVLVIWGPGLLGHPGVAFTVLIGGGYVLARAFGEILGGHLGVPRGIRKRNRMWAEFQASRAVPEPLEGDPTVLA